MSSTLEAAPANPCATDLGKAIQELKDRSIKGETLSVHDMLMPVLHHAKAHRDWIYSPDEFSENPTWVSTAWGGKYLKDLKRLHQGQCIDEVTWTFFKKISNTIEFVSQDDVELNKKKLQKFPNLRQYWVNVAHYEKIRKLKFSSPDQEVLHKKLVKILPKYFQRKHPILGKLSIHEYLLLNFNRGQINLLADPFNQTLDIMTSTSGKVVLENPKVPGGTIEIELTPSDIFRLSINQFDIQLNKTQSAYFSDRQITLGDSLFASYLTGAIDPESFMVVMNYGDLREPKKNWVKSLGLVAWSTAKVVLYQIPATAPFITLGTLVYEAIERNKTMEKARANETHLIRN
ncbi:MAG: hypothetical protein JNL01_16700 [Bdellovibrionales bacterium]|nr:hypothetical protein [Bdellovibrionales bacterium]